MNFIEKLKNDLDEFHLLKHAFYQAWSEGCLTHSTLSTYAKEYYHHVAAFPRYISAIHSNCDYLPHRQILLGNLIEEEHGEKNHPELWIQFAKGLGCSRKEVQAPIQLKSTHCLVEGYFDLVRSDFASGLGALYAYERQTPEISISKINGLKEFYNVKDDDALAFFNVHAKADTWHSEECASILETLTSEQQARAHTGALKGAQLLWEFLDEMYEIQLNTVA